MVMRIGDTQLTEVRNCPYCGVPSPILIKKWVSEGHLPRGDQGPTSRWALHACTSCGSPVLAKGSPNSAANNAEVVEVIPKPREAHEDLPRMARTFLQQAYETLHAPDAAAVMAGSAVDAMLKALGLVEGSLYRRIDEALERKILTQGMADWAHSVRLGSNRPRHADAENPHVTPDEAKNSVDFAEALASFLFVLTARIRRGIEAAEG